ncbi:MAG: SPOR domain-containing protein [Ectothiorhodospira sp.]
MKQRLVGAAVLVALAVIFLPVLLDGAGHRARLEASGGVPPEPFFHRPAPPGEGARPEPVSSPSRSEQVETMAEARSLSREEGRAPETDAGSSGSPEPVASGWVVQVGSFGRRENAQAEVERLRDAGLPAFMEDSDAEGRVLHRVKVGPEVDRRAAERLKSRLEREQDRSGILVKHP